MKEIKLTQGKVALVDDTDYEYLSQWKWYAVNYHGHFYAGRKFKNKTALMHRVILNTPDDLRVDHIDHNGLNNQRVNIRNCTASQNAMNTVPHGKSKYKGVWFSYKKLKDGSLSPRIRAGIRVDGRLINLGSFKTEEDAAREYNKAAIKYFREFKYKPVTA